MPDDMDEHDTMMDDDMEGMSEMETELTVSIHVLEGSPTPLAPVAWALHEGVNPFVSGDMGKLAGLEALAEDGDPAQVSDALDKIDRVAAHGVAAIPTGMQSAGPAGPGSGYSFTVHAADGRRLSFATMYVQSNDLFFSPGPDGLALFHMDEPADGEVTEMIHLYDAGTEMNEEPGHGPNQAPRQMGPDTGTSEDHPVRPAMDVMDGYAYPEVETVIMVTVSPAAEM
jgi:hypothetical protein